MVIKPLQQVEQETVLSAIVECDFDLVRAAYFLQIAPQTIYRMLKRWSLPSPVGGNAGVQRYSDYLTRCETIRSRLDALRDLIPR